MKNNQKKTQAPLEDQHTPEEIRLLKATRKLEKKTKKYLNDLTAIDSVIQGCSVQTARLLDLENNYFKNISAVVRAAVKLELLNAKVQAGLAKYNPDDLEEDINCTNELESYRMHSLS